MAGTAAAEARSGTGWQARRRAGPEAGGTAGARGTAGEAAAGPACGAAGPAAGGEHPADVSGADLLGEPGGVGFALAAGESADPGDAVAVDDERRGFGLAGDGDGAAAVGLGVADGFDQRFAGGAAWAGGPGDRAPREARAARAVAEQRGRAAGGSA